MKQLVVFDLDGTLIDSRTVMERAFRSAYVQEVGHGKPPLDQFFQLLGDSFPNILTALGLPQSMWEPFRAFSRAHADEVVVCGDMPGVVSRLRNKGVATAILTGKDRDRTIELLELLKLTELFDRIATTSDGFTPKPAPDGLLVLCEALSVSPRSTVMVGDSPFDIQAAVQNDSVPIGCSWGHGSPSDLLDAGAIAVAETTDELESLLMSCATNGLLDGEDDRTSDLQP